jgi:hypothetical protein
MIQWMGPFTVIAQTALNIYLFSLPPKWRVVSDFNEERLWPYLSRPDHLGGDCGPPPAIPGADGRPQLEVVELLWFKIRYCRPHVLVQWVGRDASGETWELLDNLTNCKEAIAAFKQVNGRSLPRPAPPLETTGRRRHRPAPALFPCRLHSRRSAARGPRRAARGADAAFKCFTGGPTTAGSVAQWPVPVRGGPSRMRWLTTGSRPCAARRTRYLTLPRTAPAVCSSPRHPRPGSPAPCDPKTPALTLGLVGNSSQLAGPARVVYWPGQITAANNGRQI